MAAPEAEPKAKKPPKKYGYLLVSLPGWPSQDPGRQMIYREYPEVVKAERKAKRFMKRYPDYVWEGKGLTKSEAHALKNKPFKIPGLGVVIRPTGRGAQVQRMS